MHLERLRLFAELINRGNYSRTAEALGVSKGYLSKQIKSLEHELDAQLLLRNTRNMKLTAAGETLYQQAKRLVSFWPDTQKLLDESVDSLAGTVRFTAPTGFMEYVLLPVICDVREQYPDINIVSETGNQTYNLVSAPYDFAVRITNTPPEDMIAVKLMSSRYLCCASPDYLHRRGKPDTPEDLKHHDCVTLSFWKSWSFERDGEFVEVDLDGKLQFSDNAILKQSALHGQGITRLASYQIAKELEQGTLVELFEDFQPETRDIYLVYPQLMHRPERVKRVMDAIKSQVG